MTDITYFPLSRDAGASHSFAPGGILRAYWWAQGVARAYARTGDVARSVLEAGAPG